MVQSIDFNSKDQIKLYNEILELMNDFHWNEDKESESRYYLNNGNFDKGDAITLYGMIRIVKPKRIIEIGSGFTSALMLDVNDKFFKSKDKEGIEFTFIEPYPEERLNLLLKESDKDNCILYSSRLQDLDLSIFDSLEENDILFIDSSHVSKAFSDVNMEIFEILPRLKKGIYIHFHDVFWPFEYPSSWVINHKRYWNESYILRAFLMNNKDYEIILFNHYLMKVHNIGHSGGSFYIKKL